MCSSFTEVTESRTALYLVWGSILHPEASCPLNGPICITGNQLRGKQRKTETSLKLDIWQIMTCGRASHKYISTGNHQQTKEEPWQTYQHHVTIVFVRNIFVLSSLCWINHLSSSFLIFLFLKSPFHYLIAPSIRLWLTHLALLHHWRRDFRVKWESKW